MSESYYLLAAIFLPLLLAPVAYFVSRKIGINARYVVIVYGNGSIYRNAPSTCIFTSWWKVCV